MSLNGFHQEIHCSIRDLYGFCPMLLYVLSEKDVAHRCVSRNNDFINFLPNKIMLFTHFYDLIVQRCYKGFTQFTFKFTIIRNSVHDVTATETLGVFKGTDRDSLTVFKIHKICYHSSGADVYGKSIEMSTIPINRFIVVIDNSIAMCDQGIKGCGWINTRFCAVGVDMCENLWRAA